MYTATSWVAGTTPASQTNMNHLETQYAQATTSFNEDLFSGFVLYGLSASKDLSTANQLDVTAGVAYLLQSDGTTYRTAPTSSTQTTSSISTTYYLYLQPAGTFYWSTSNSPAANSLAICQVSTDGSGNILTVTDKRNQYATVFPSSTGAFAFGVPANGGLSIDSLGTAIGIGVASPSALTATPVSGSGLGVGVYGYKVTYVSYSGESALGSAGTCTTTSSNKQVNLSAIPTGPTGTLKRNVYRTAVGGSSYSLLTTIADNTTTTFTDTTADGSLGVAAPSHPTMGGDFWKANGGSILAAIYGDGAAAFAGGFTNIGGQATAGSFGAPVTVGGILGVQVSATTLTTIYTFTPAATGFYRVNAYAWFGNTSDQSLTMRVNYTDGTSSSATHTFMQNDSGAFLNGGTSVAHANGIQAMPITIYASSAANIVLQFQDPGGSPNDQVSCSIERLA